jgi:hypothetical membrane protein
VNDYRKYRAPVTTILSAFMFLVLLAGLQILKPEFDPRWHVISEYEIGHYGWLMRVNFAFLAASCWGIFAALRSYRAVKVSRVGLAFIFVAGLGAAMAGVFVSDPIVTSHHTWHGILHLVGSAFFIPSIPVGATLITRSLLRSTAWQPARRSLLLSVALLWTGLASMGITLASTFRGSFGSSVPVGWPNRYLITVFCLWMAFLAWQTMKHPSSSPKDKTYFPSANR